MIYTNSKKLILLKENDIVRYIIRGKINNVKILPCTDGYFLSRFQGDNIFHFFKIIDVPSFIGKHNCDLSMGYLSSHKLENLTSLLKELLILNENL